MLLASLVDSDASLASLGASADPGEGCRQAAPLPTCVKNTSIMLAELEPEELECCICMSDHVATPAAGLRCANAHFLCVGCLAPYLELETSMERLATNEGALRCPQLECDSEPFHEWQVRRLSADAAQPALLAVYLRGQQQLAELLVVRTALVCPADGCGYMVSADGTHDRLALAAAQWCWRCPMCNSLSCHRCQPPTLLDEDVSFESHVHRGCHAAGQPSGGSSPPAAPLDQQGRDRLRHQLSEILTSGAVARCPSNLCPTLIVKTEGCNVLSCSECGLFFCYLCNTALGFSHHGAHGGHYHDAGCWMFDGGIFEPSLVQKLRTHGMIRGFMRTLHDQDQEWLLRDETARKALSDVHFVTPDASLQLQATVERLRRNIDTAARIQQQDTLADLVPPACQARVARVLALAEMSDDDRAEAETTRRRNEIRTRRERPGPGCCPPLGAVCMFVALGVSAHFLVKQIDHFVAQNTAQWLAARAKATSSGATKANAVAGGTSGAFSNLTAHGQRNMEMLAWTLTAGLTVGSVALTFVAARAATGLARRVVVAAMKCGAVAGRSSRASTASSTWSAGSFASPTVLHSTKETAMDRLSAPPIPALLRAMPPFWSGAVPVKPPATWPGR